MMSRKRFSEREVLEVVFYQGIELLCFRCWLPITKEQIPFVEREHLCELALGGADEPVNCRYSHGECHARVTNGTPATTAGSSKHRIAKTKGTRAQKFAVQKPRLDKGPEPKRRFGNSSFQRVR